MNQSEVKWKAVELSNVAFGSVIRFANKTYLYLNESQVISLDRHFNYTPEYIGLTGSDVVQVLELGEYRPPSSNGTSFIHLAQYLAGEPE